MRTLLLACLLALSTATATAQTTPPASTEYSQADAQRDIGRVIEDFRTAIIDKDKAKFLALFPADGPVAWRSVIGDANLETMRRKNPDARKDKFDPEKSHLSFIDGIVASKYRSEETFDNVHIDTDGDVAAVAFDYRFLSNGKQTNHGREAWNLVRTDTGWKIVSVVWSLRWDPAPKQD